MDRDHSSEFKSVRRFGSFIYYIEGSEEFGPMSKELFLQPYKFITSLITLMETLIIPYRNNRIDLIEKTNESFFGAIFTEHTGITKKVVDTAAQLRAEKKSLKSFDALQLASAIESNCNYFITNDNRLTTPEEIELVVLKRI